MKRAVALPAYSDTQPFAPPAGVVQVTIDPQSGDLAAPACPQVADEYFIAGTEPTQYCGQLAGPPSGAWLGHMLGGAPHPPPPPVVPSNPSHAPAAASASPGQPAPAPEQKKGFFDRIFGIFGGEKKPADSSKPQQ